MKSSKDFEPAHALIDTVEILSQLKMRYFLVGSFASGFRGEFRATNDLDFVCDFPFEQLEKFCALAKKKFYCDEQAVENAVRNFSSFNLIHESTFVKVDFFTKTTLFEEEQFTLASCLNIPSSNSEVCVSTAEYNIIAKMNWYNKSNGILERQLKDVRSMLLVNKYSLDRNYLERWSKYFNTTDLLKEISNSLPLDNKG